MWRLGGDRRFILPILDQGLYKAKEGGRSQVVIHVVDAATGTSTVKTNSEKPVLKKELALKVGEQSVCESSSDHVQARVVELESLLQQRDKELSMISECDALTGMPLRQIFLQTRDAELSKAALENTLVGVISIASRDTESLVSTFSYSIR